MKTKTSKGKVSRRTLRGWMTLTDLIAAACGSWAAVGGWQQTHSVVETLIHFALVYGGVHVFKPMVSNGGHR
ncbi:hypothetical protein ACWIGY_37945 [Streptomyces anulatus]